ncbi:MAG: hypothetical protein ACRDGM_16200 [bacterium]
MRSFRLDPDDIVLGSVLRRAMPSLVSERDLRYDTDRSAALNDLVFGEILEARGRRFAGLTKTFLERLYLAGDAVKVKNEMIAPAPCVAVVGNRYAPPHLIGGLTNPLTGHPNGEIRAARSWTACSASTSSGTSIMRLGPRNASASRYTASLSTAGGDH